ISGRRFGVWTAFSTGGGGRRGRADLAGRVLLPRGGATPLVTRLERDGLVQRIVAEGARRSFFAALPPAGHQRLRDSRPTHNEVIREHLTRRLTAKQLHTLGALWGKILQT